jgi:hypothetical protein
MAETIQRSFTGGEISPAMRSRADVSKYMTGLALCQNAFIRSQGGIYSRQGMRFIDEVADSTSRARLIPFSFNTDQTYILVFEDSKIRFVRDGGYVLEDDGLTIYEIASPYLEAELPRLGFTQRADVMTLVHHNHAVRNLSRLADNNWTLTEVSFTPEIEPPVFSDDYTRSISAITNANPAAVTVATSHGLTTGDVVSISGVSGMTELNGNPYQVNVTGLTTFTLNGVNSTAYGVYAGGGAVTQQGLMEFGDGAGDFDKTYTYVITSVATDGEESIPSESRSITTPSLSTTAGVRVSWDAVAGAAYYRIYKDPSNGTGIYGWIGDSTRLSFDDFNIAPITSDAPPSPRDIFTDLTGSITDLDVSDLIFTSPSHQLLSGDTVLIDGLLAPTDFNGQEFPVRVIDGDTFQILTEIFGPYLTYTSGGTFFRAGQNPSVVNYYQQRLVFANTPVQRQTVFTTQVGNYNSLRASSPSRADDAITFTVAGKQVNEIRHIIELDSMVLLTAGAEQRVTEGQDQVLTPSTFGLRKQSQNGASWVTPVIINDSIVYVQEKGTRLRDMNYDVGVDKFAGNDLSIMAEHLFEDYTISEMAYTDEPYGILWAVRSDGVLLGLTYQREHQVWAWHQHVTDGVVESVATISEDGRDALYLIVRRTINGNTKRYIERMEKRVTTAPEDTFCVDSGLSYSGAAVTTISGLSHLEGEEVAVVADGNVVSGLTVTAGAIELPVAAAKVVVGLPFTVAIETLDIDIADLKQTLKHKEISVSKVTIEFEKSRGGWVGPLKDSGAPFMVEMKPRFVDYGYDAIPLRTIKDEVFVQSEWNQGGGLRIEQRIPMPMAILSIIPDVDVG